MSMLWRIFTFVALEVYYRIICYSSSSVNLHLSQLISRQCSVRHIPSDTHNVAGHVALAEHTGHQSSFGSMKEALWTRCTIEPVLLDCSRLLFFCQHKEKLMDYCRQVWLVGEEEGVVVASTDLSLMHLSPFKPQN